MLIQPVDTHGKAYDDAIIAIDGAQAGIGDHVLVVFEGKGARQVMQDESVPCEAIIVGIIDHVSLGETISG
jgi:microcompartment protein CcmK/EutM